MLDLQENYTKIWKMKNRNWNAEWKLCACDGAIEKTLLALTLYEKQSDYQYISSQDNVSLP